MIFESYMMCLKSKGSGSWPGQLSNQLDFAYTNITYLVYIPYSSDKFTRVQYSNFFVFCIYKKKFQGRVHLSDMYGTKFSDNRIISSLHATWYQGLNPVNYNKKMKKTHTGYGYWAASKTIGTRSNIPDLIHIPGFKFLYIYCY